MIDSLRITIVYDNYLFKPELETGWGFSVLVEGDGTKMLFDTGGNGESLLKNLQKLDVNLKEIGIVFFSHIHGDHTGGLRSLLRVNPKLEVVLPRSFPKGFKRDLNCQEVTGFQEILPGFYTTGELGKTILEQSLVIRSKKGLVIITGCAHPGVADIVAEVKHHLDEPIYLVLGGFHLFGSGEDEIKKITARLKELGVMKVAPCHCSGDQARKIFAREYGEDFIKIGVGWKEEIKDGSQTE